MRNRWVQRRPAINHRTLAHHLGRGVRPEACFLSRPGPHAGGPDTQLGNKNDPKDAQVILHMLEIGAVQFLPRSSAAQAPSDIQGNCQRPHEIVFTPEDRALAPHPDSLSATSYYPRDRNDFIGARGRLVPGLLGEVPIAAHDLGHGSGRLSSRMPGTFVGRKVSKEQLLSRCLCDAPLVRLDFPSTRIRMPSACSRLRSPLRGEALSGDAIEIELEPSSFSPTLHRLSAADDHSGYRPDQRHDHPGRGR